MSPCVRYAGRGRLTVRDSKARFSDIGPLPTPYNQIDDVHPTVVPCWSRVVAAVICYSNPIEHRLSSGIRSDAFEHGFTFCTAAAACREGNPTSATRVIAWEEGQLWSSVGNGKGLYECLSSGPPDRISHSSRGGPRCANGP